jgi:hypothetical protein
VSGAAQIRAMPSALADMAVLKALTISVEIDFSEPVH